DDDLAAHLCPRPALAGRHRFGLRRCGGALSADHARAGGGARSGHRAPPRRALPLHRGGRAGAGRVGTACRDRSGTPRRGPLHRRHAAVLAWAAHRSRPGNAGRARAARDRCAGRPILTGGPASAVLPRVPGRATLATIALLAAIVVLALVLRL